MLAKRLANTRIQQDINALIDAVAALEAQVGYRTVPLATPATSTSFDGDAFSDTAWTEIDLSTAFGLPAAIKGVFARIGGRDSGSSGQRCYAALGGDGSSPAIIADISSGTTNDQPANGSGFVPCNGDGNIYYMVDASGTGTFDLWIEIYGYIL